MLRAADVWIGRGFGADDPLYRDRQWQEAAYHHIHTIEFRYRQRYNLPPTDPRFLSTTIEDMITDDWAHYLANIRTIALQRGLLAEKLTLDVLLEAGEHQDIGQGLDIAMARSMLAEQEGGEPAEIPETNESDEIIRMDFNARS